MTDILGNTNNVLYLDQLTNDDGKSEAQSLPPILPTIYPDIRYARRILNQVHAFCTSFDAEIFMHQQASDVLVVTRQLHGHNGEFDSYVSITRYCFFNQGGDSEYNQSIELPGFMTETVFAGFLDIPDSVRKDQQLEDKEFIMGPSGCKLLSFSRITGKFCNRVKLSDRHEKLDFFFMPPGFTCVIKVKSNDSIRNAVSKLNELEKDPKIDSLFSNTPQSGLNHILFRCSDEERDISGGHRSPYGLSNYGEFQYAGITTYMYLLNQLKLTKDMGAELFDNIRTGDWLIDFVVERLRDYQNQEQEIGLGNMIEFLDHYISYVKLLPPYLKPKYASRIIEVVHNQAIKEIL